MNLTIYEENDTMRLIGQQIPDFSQEVFHGLRDIITANQEKPRIELAIDIFLWGHIHGIRAERAKRKGIRYE